MNSYDQNIRELLEKLWQDYLAGEVSDKDYMLKSIKLGEMLQEPTEDDLAGINHFKIYLEEVVQVRV